MASKTWTSGTVVDSPWLQDVDGIVYGHVTSIAALRLLSKTRFSKATVLGYYAAGDGGGGQYYYDSADTTSTDNGGTIIVAADGGRWKLIYTTSVSLAQFGAKGDAKSPTVPPLGSGLTSFNPVVDIPTGTDDTVAIRNAINWALSVEMMSNYLDPNVWGSPNVGPGSQPFWGGSQLTGYPVVLTGRPGAGYLVSGDNILGPQATRNGKLYFDGQGCSFEWLPTATNDSFIDKLDLIERPVLENFNLRTWGFTGNRGRFIHTQDTKQFMNVLRGPRLHNINIDRGGYYNLTTDPLNVSVPGPTTGNALSKVIHLEGTNLCDTWDISHFQAWGYFNFLTLSNSEAVAISIHQSDLGSCYPGAVHVDVTTGYSGGLWFTNCELGMLGSGQTWFRTRASAASIGECSIKQSRMETRYDDFTIIDAEFGAFYIENLRPNYGNPTAMTNAYSVKASKWFKTVRFVDCWMPQKAQSWVYTSADYATYSGNFAQIEFNNTEFPSGVQIWSWINSNTLATVADFPAIFSAKLQMRDIRVVNSNQGLNYCWGTAIAGVPDQKIRLGVYNQTDGKSYVDTSPLALPIGIIITSILCVSEAVNTAVTDRIRLTFNGAFYLDSMLASGNVTKNQLIPATNKGVCIVSTVSGYNNISASYNLGGAGSATKPSAYIELTYRGLQSAVDLNTGSLLATMV